MSNKSLLDKRAEAQAARPSADVDYSPYLNEYRSFVKSLRVPPLDFEIDETPPPERRPVALGIVLLLAAGMAGFLAGYAMGDVPIYEPEPRFEMCQGSC